MSNATPEVAPEVESLEAVEPVESTLLEGFLTTGRLPLDPSWVEAAYAVGHQFYSRDEHHKAIDLFRLLVLARPDEARGWFSLGAAHEASGDEERAERMYEVARGAPHGERHRREATAYLARLLVNRGEVEMARGLVAELLAVIDEGDELRSIARQITAAATTKDGTKDRTKDRTKDGRSR